MSGAGTTQPAIGFVGLGKMGGRMVARLCAAGCDVIAFDVDAAAREHAAGLGAAVAASARAAVADADIVLLSLPTPAVVADVLSGADGLLAAVRPGTVIADTSTIDPALARRLDAEARACGATYLDTPVSGSVMRAERGELTVMVGGDRAALERCRPVLEHIGSTILPLGSSGCGQVAKLCNNVVTATILAGMAEAFLTAKRNGVGPAALAEVISSSSGANWLLEGWWPLTVAVDDYDPRFSLDLMHKDVSLFSAVADAAELPAPVTQSVRQVLKLARAQGLGARDMTAVVQLYEQLAGTRLHDEAPR